MRVLALEDVARFQAMMEEQSIPEPNSGCWIWTGSFFRNGGFPRGKLRYRGGTFMAHRISYEACKGDIPEGGYVCHRCDVTLCVNPDHLWLGNAKSNMDDMAAKGRKVCAPMGGELNPNRKLSWADVRQIRESGLPAKELAAVYPVSRSTLNSIIAGSSWREPARLRGDAS